VGYGSQTKEGVVTYPTMLTVNNDDLSLRPGMTATAEITTVTREDVLLVPNAALRYTPAPAVPGKAKGGSSLVGQLIPRPPSSAPKARSAAKGAQQQVWVLRGNEAVAVTLTVGASNGRYTEVAEGALEPGALVIVEAVATGKK
jgi:HlyD family secretion protein